MYIVYTLLTAYNLSYPSAVDRDPQRGKILRDPQGLPFEFSKFGERAGEGGASEASGSFGYKT